MNISICSKGRGGPISARLLSQSPGIALPQCSVSLLDLPERTEIDVITSLTAVIELNPVSVTTVSVTLSRLSSFKLHLRLLEAIYYFAKEVSGFERTDEEAKRFTIDDAQRRRTTYELLIDHLAPPDIWAMVEAIFNQIFRRYLSDELNLQNHEETLADMIYVLVRLEERQQTSNEAKMVAEDLNAERSVEGAKKVMNAVNISHIEPNASIAGDGKFALT
jgi:hypothetical protein